MQTTEQTKRKQLITMVVAASALMLLLMAGLWISDSKTGQKQISPSTKTDELTKNYALPTDPIRPEDKWMASGSVEIANQQKEMEVLKQQLALMQERQGKEGAKATPAFDSAAMDLAPPTLKASAALPPLPPPPAPPIPPQGTVVTTPAIPPTPAAIEEIDLGEGKAVLVSKADDKSAGSTASDLKSVNSFVPSGAFAKVVFLTGFDAPTGGQAQANALPVVMRVKSFMQLPNLYKSNLKECFIVGNGYGDMASERAYIRTERMSCVLRNGKVLEVKIKGHVAGEDASFGMRGKVVSKQGQLVAKSFFAGLFSGMGDSIAKQNAIVQTSALGTVTSVDPDKTVQSGLTTGLSTSSAKIADFWLNQANSIFPIIEISAGRIGEIFLLEGADFGELKLGSTDVVGEVK